jgi:hypothetical protein
MRWTASSDKLIVVDFELELKIAFCRPFGRARDREAFGTFGGRFVDTPTADRGNKVIRRRCWRPAFEILAVVDLQVLVSRQWFI